MVITPKTTVTVRGVTYNAGTRYRVNYTTGEAIVMAGALTKPKPVEDPAPVEEPKPTTRRKRNNPKKFEP